MPESVIGGHITKAGAHFILAAAGVLFALCVGATSAVEPVTFDGKNLIFPPESRLDPVDISSLKFDFSGIPDDKRFVIGKVYRAQFTRHPIWSRMGWIGSLKYVVFTKWNTKGNIEVFYWPDRRRFLKCVSVDDGYRCGARGRSDEEVRRTSWSLWTFKDQQISIYLTTTSRDTPWEARLETVGEIPIPDAKE